VNESPTSTTADRCAETATAGAIPPDLRADRLAAVRDHAGEAAALVATAGPNCRYLSGFAGERDRVLALLVPVASDESPTLVAPRAHRSQVERRTDVPCRFVGRNESDAVAAGVDVVAPDGPLGLDPHAQYRFGVAIQGTGRAVRPTHAFERARVRKDIAEVRALRRAATVADRVSSAVRRLGTDAVGMTERDLAAEIRHRLHQVGERLSFPVVVGSGPNGAEPARRAADRVVRAGEPVVLDFGAFVDGYASDQTRTVVFGDESPPEGFLADHAAVAAALESGVAAVAPRTTTAAVAEAVRGKLADRGIAGLMTHPTGHGVGLEAHEAPSVTADVADPTVLEPGMVFSIEPGVYRPDEYGVRLETLVIVTEDGCERLNESPLHPWTGPALDEPGGP
jgi:Xaa-Pro aminopeptidase